MVRSKRIQQIHKSFIESAIPIRIDPTSQPGEDELDEEHIELPGSVHYLVTKPRDGKSIRFDDIIREKTNAIRAWPLMNFSEFMSFARHAAKLCRRAGTAVAVVSAAALNELMDIAIRIYRQMTRLGTLGPGEVRFKARIFLHLHIMTVQRVMYTGAAAMSVFKSATEVFMTRLPASAFDDSSPVRSPKKPKPTASSPASPAACSPVSTSRKSAWSTPKWGCYVCGATDHYCSNRSIHPLESGAKYPKVSDAIKKKMLARVDASVLTADKKEKEKKKLKDFWSRRCAP